MTGREQDLRGDGDSRLRQGGDRNPTLCHGGAGLRDVRCRWNAAVKRAEAHLSRLNLLGQAKIREGQSKPDISVSKGTPNAQSSRQRGSFVCKPRASRG